MPSTVLREREAFEELRERLRGRLLTPDETGWDDARRAWNLAVDQHPIAVAWPLDAADTATVVRFAGAHGLRVLAQGTGHLAAAIDSWDRTILLRTQHFDSIDIDPAHATVRVGAGVSWAQLTEELAAYGLMGLAGSAPDVGAVGYLLGGGCSWFAREHGLACNSILAAEIVTASGACLTVDGLSDPEVFWALRGGGGNFAVVTSLTLALHRTPDVYAGMLAFPLERAGEVWQAYARWTRGLAESATTSIRLLRVPPLPDIPEPLRGKAFAVVDGAIDASDAEARRILEPLRALGPAIDTFGRMPVAALGQVHMDPPGPVPAVGDGMSLAALDENVIGALLDAAGPSVPTALLSVEVRHLGGAASRPIPAGGVVDHLPSEFSLFAVGIAPDAASAAAVRGEIDSLLTELRPWAGEREYSNFRESPADAAEFYSPGDLDRLRRVKDRVDPAGVIRSAHPLG